MQIDFLHNRVILTLKNIFQFPHRKSWKIFSQHSFEIESLKTLNPILAASKVKLSAALGNS